LFDQHGPEFKLRSGGQGRGLMTGRGQGPIGVPIGAKQFSGFGDVLLPSNVLVAGNQYVFTFESGEWFFFGSISTIRDGLNERLANFGTITGVSRGFFSDRYVVNVVPSVNVTLSDWLSAFDVSWRDMGYDSITFVSAEGGLVSTQPGGVSEVVGNVLPSLGSAVGSTASEILKPIYPYILIGVIAYAGITMLPKLMSKGRVRS
jgi:hypothetical protein